MELSDWLTIAAILLGPLIGIQLTRFLDEKKEKRERKLRVFKTLMATRSYTISLEHVTALNIIDIEFDKSNDKEKAVLIAWNAYFDFLNTIRPTDSQWYDKRKELFVEMLHRMAIVLDYDLDKTHIKNSSYSPEAHCDTENDLFKIRKGLIEVLEGKRSIPMDVVKFPHQDQTNQNDQK